MLQILSHTSHTFVVNRMKTDKNRKFCCIVEQHLVYLQYGKVKFISDNECLRV